MTQPGEIGAVQAFAEQVFRLHLGEPLSVEPMRNARHHLFLVESGDGRRFVVKIYRTTVTLFKDMEVIAYGRLDGSPFIRRYFAAAPANGNYPGYIITEFVAGDTLLDRIEAGALDASIERSAVGAVAAFVRSCGAIPVQGFGELNDDLVGEDASWTAFLDQYCVRVRASIAQLAPTPVRSVMLQGLQAVDTYRMRNARFLETRPGLFVPIDMNQANFLIDPDGRLVVLDLKSFLAADPLFALGEWTSHTHGTSRCDAFRRAWGPLAAEEEACVRYYALICNLDVLLYVINNDAGDPDAATPWGNPRRFVDLIQDHAAALAAPCRS